MMPIDGKRAEARKPISCFASALPISAAARYIWVNVDTPDPTFERTLAAAQGLFQLEMWNDAWAELEELQPEFRHLSEVIFLRVLILNNL